MVALNLAGTSPAPRDTHQLLMTIRDVHGWHSSETPKGPLSPPAHGGIHQGAEGARAQHRDPSLASQSPQLPQQLCWLLA